ncbi:MAG TPA: hypothetical protein VF469_38200 [Kofleriaceae bacterium]
MQGKSGRGTSATQARQGDRSGSAHVGKRTLVEQIAALRAMSSPVGLRAAVNSASGLPRLQLKGIPGHASVGIDGAAVQRKAQGETEIAVPTGGVNLPGFIDASDGANLRTGPAEVGGKIVIDAPLPPATRVFVSGTHPSAPAWWYVTAFLPDKIVRGYVQRFRVNTDLPEPLAKLHEVKSGDTVEKLAVQEYASSDPGRKGSSCEWKLCHQRADVWSSRWYAVSDLWPWVPSVKPRSISGARCAQ